MTLPQQWPWNPNFGSGGPLTNNPTPVLWTKLILYFYQSITHTRIYIYIVQGGNVFTNFKKKSSSLPTSSTPVSYPRGSSCDGFRSSSFQIYLHYPHNTHIPSFLDTSTLNILSSIRFLVINFCYFIMATLEITICIIGLLQPTIIQYF